MKKRICRPVFLLIFLLIFLLMLEILLVKTCFSQDTINLKPLSEPLVEINRIKLEEHLENRLKDRLTSLLQDEGIFVIVKVRLTGEKISIVSGEKKEGKEYALPGVPVEKKLTDRKKDEIKIERQASRIENISTWIFLSKEIAEESLDKAKKLSSKIMGIDLERGDTLTIEVYLKETTFWSRLRDSDDMVKLIFGAVFLLTAIIFLFGPLGIFLAKVSKSISLSKMQQVPGGISEGVLVEAKGGVTKEEGDVVKVEKKFDFINENNIDDLSYVLTSDSSVEEAIAVLSNLPAYLANKVFSKLPAELQQRIIEQEKMVKFMDPDAVKAVQEKIKVKINNIYGGVQRVSHLIQGSDQAVRENLIEWLKESDPDFADEVEHNLIEFEDLLKYDDISFRRIFRAAGLQAFAQAIKTLNEETVLGFTAKLNPDIALLVNDQLKILPLHKRKSEEEQMRILGIVERLVRDGEVEPVKAGEIE